MRELSNHDDVASSQTSSTPESERQLPSQLHQIQFLKANCHRFRRDSELLCQRHEVLSVEISGLNEQSRQISQIPARLLVLSASGWAYDVVTNPSSTIEPSNMKQISCMLHGATWI
jgi:hypothetical protein